MNPWTGNSILVFIMMAFTLGLRHGFDLDHLSTVDSITRTVAHNKTLSRSIGFLFALGHGFIVIFVSFIIGSGCIKAEIPAWLEGVGNGISIFFLFIFGIITLWNVLYTPKSHANVTTFCIKKIFFKKVISQKANPFYIMLIGALFALSFDTFTQVALFSLAANAIPGTISGCMVAVTLGILFTLGMITSDGLNGLLISGLIRRASKASVLISKMVGCLIALFSLTIGTINLLKMIY